MVDTKYSVHISELPLRTQINLRGRPEDKIFQRKIQRLLGGALPAQSGQLHHFTVDFEADRVALKILWLAPDEWLMVADFDGRMTLLQALEKALAGCHHAVTDLSANRKIIALEGAGGPDILAQGCALDLDVAAFPPCSALQSRVARTQAIIERATDMTTFHLYVRSSFSEYLINWLKVAALNEGFAV